MQLKVIACKVFEREIAYAAARSPHKLDIEFIELGEHVHSATLRGKLQTKIDDAAGVDAIVLGYGLCGRATDGLTARTIPLVLPRSHDCGGILLGSRKRFEEIFSAMPSTPFSSVGFAEHGEYYFRDGELQDGDGWAALVEQYGEEDASYIYEAMHPRLDGQLQPVYFIEAPEIPAPAAREKCRRQAAKENREYRELCGSLRLLTMLLNGDWPDEEFLTVRPGQSIAQVGDWDRIIKCNDPL